MKEIQIRTHHRSELVDITAEAEKTARESRLEQGWVGIFVPHTTAGITVNEKADPEVGADLLAALERLVPRQAGYRHAEGNADSHIKASLMGSSLMVPVEAGRLRLGTWQGIFLCEFDGPRTRRVILRAIGNSH